MIPDAIIIILVLLLTVLTSSITLILLYCTPRELKVVAQPAEPPPSYVESIVTNHIMV